MLQKPSTVVASFNYCEGAIEAVDLLMDNGLEEDNISIIGKFSLLEGLIDDDIDLDDDESNVLPSFEQFDVMELASLSKVFVAGALLNNHKVNGKVVSFNEETIEAILKSWGLAKPFIAQYFAQLAEDKILLLATGNAKDMNLASSKLKFNSPAKSVVAHTRPTAELATPVAKPLDLDDDEEDEDDLDIDVANVPNDWKNEIADDDDEEEDDDSEEDDLDNED